MDPDYGAAWVGQALIAKHFGDQRASRVLFEHAVSLTEGSLQEADYGLGEAAFDASVDMRRRMRQTRGSPR